MLINEKGESISKKKRGIPLFKLVDKNDHFNIDITCI
jgi:hypothetical protein